LFFRYSQYQSGVLLGYSQLLIDAPPDSTRAQEMKTFLYRATLRLIDEVKNQRELSAAETGDLELHPVAIRTRKLLNSVREFYQVHEVAEDRFINIDPATADLTLTSDRVLVERVLGNLVKNALEASQPGQTVTLSCFTDGGERVIFSVHNETAMPREVQLQMFQRSFSTKGSGRGLGTYSVKLFTERYLQGTVTFATSAEKGTTFTVSYPRELIAAGRR
jgi:signal transduction histidine kinase